MANRDLTPFLPVGRSNGGNVACMRALEGDALPQYSYAPEVLHTWQLDHVALKDLARTTSIQTTTVQITGADPDGDYIPTIAGTLADGTAFSIELDAFTASSDDSDAIAAGLEAILEAARADELVGITTDESVATDTITVVFATGVNAEITLDVPATSTSTIADSAVQTLTINDVFDNDAAVGPMLRGEPALRIDTAFAGPTSLTIEMGDDASDGGTADADGLVTATTGAAAGYFGTVGAAQYANRVELAFSPTGTIRYTGGTPFDLTAGKCTFVLAYYPLPA